MRVGTPLSGSLLLAISCAFAADRMAPANIQTTFFNGKPFTASTASGTQFKMIFSSDGNMTWEPRGKEGKKNAGTWKLDDLGFARLGTMARRTATSSCPLAKINGPFRKALPRLQCGANNDGAGKKGGWPQAQGWLGSAIGACAFGCSRPTTALANSPRASEPLSRAQRSRRDSRGA